MQLTSHQICIKSFLSLLSENYLGTKPMERHASRWRPVLLALKIVQNHSTRGMLKLCNHSIRSIEFIAPYCFYLESWDIHVLQFHCYSKTWSGYVRLTKHIDWGRPKCNLLDAQTNPQGMGIPKEIFITKQPHTLPQKMPQTMTKLQNSVLASTCEDSLFWNCVLCCLGRWQNIMGGFREKCKHARIWEQEMIKEVIPKMCWKRRWNGDVKVCLKSYVEMRHDIIIYYPLKFLSHTG